MNCFFNSVCWYQGPWQCVSHKWAFVWNPSDFKTWIVRNSELRLSLFNTQIIKFETNCVDPFTFALVNISCNLRTFFSRSFCLPFSLSLPIIIIQYRFDRASMKHAYSRLLHTLQYWWPMRSHLNGRYFVQWWTVKTFDQLWLSHLLMLGLSLTDKLPLVFLLRSFSIRTRFMCSC